MANVAVALLALVAVGVNTLTWVAEFKMKSTEHRMGAGLFPAFMWVLNLGMLVACIMSARASVVARPLRWIMAVLAGISGAVLAATMLMG